MMEPSVFNPIEMSRGISEYGFMVVTSACFLFMSATILFFFIRWFVRIINNIIEDQRNIQKEILQLQKEQIALLEKIRDTVGATLVVVQNTNVPDG